MTDWLTALIGGVLIGLAATLLLWSIGRIAGISGIVNGVVGAARGDRAWRVAFLVGFGTRMGNGCTSGHGVCGLGRLSWRSFAAVLTFMAAGIATVYVMRHLVGTGA